MLQRIQTLYFLLALIGVSLSMFNLALFSFEEADGSTMTATAYSVVHSLTKSSASSSLWIYSSVAVIATLTTLLMYKDRDKQLLLSKLALTITILTGGWFGFSGYIAASLTESSVVYSVAFYGHIAAIPFLILGLLGVRKDKKLIDSIDRIR